MEKRFKELVSLEPKLEHLYNLALRLWGSSEVYNEILARIKTSDDVGNFSEHENIINNVAGDYYDRVFKPEIKKLVGFYALNAVKWQTDDHNYVCLYLEKMVWESVNKCARQTEAPGTTS